MLYYMYELLLLNCRLCHMFTPFGADDEEYCTDEGSVCHGSHYSLFADPYKQPSC